MGHRLRGKEPVVQLPHALQLVQVFSAHAAHVLFQHGQQLQPAVEQLAVRHVVSADTADVLVHDLLEALQTVDRQQVARRYGPGDDLVAADAVVLEWLEDRPFEVLVFLLADLGLVPPLFHHVLDRRLAGDPAFREGP
jgi:hypothetical protein